MNKKQLDAVSKSIRSLSMDAIQKAQSGHPGLPLGCAELASLLYGEIMQHNPENPLWINRDRFVLSAGHGSMLLYAILHLSGYNLSLDDIKNFRQLGSKTPGHPEWGYTEGVDVTTGPLGQGLAMAVGMAIAETMLASKFNTEKTKLIDHYTYVLLGEGCLMEGVSSEASSLAGHLGLGKLIAFYDENRISIDGSTDLTFTEDVQKRYEAYGWQVLSGSMYDYEEIAALVAKAKKDSRPSFIMLKSTIGKNAPTVEGLAAAHGAPLGKEGIQKAKEVLGIHPDESFYVDPEAYAYFTEKKALFEKNYTEWQDDFASWAKDNPDLKKEWDTYFNEDELSFDQIDLPVFSVGDSLATRASSGKALTALADSFRNMVGGSADLQGPNLTSIKDSEDYAKDNRGGRYIRYGIREFAMASISNGIQIHGGFRAFCATFLVFSDYARPALRLSALMKLPVLYIFTHDSIFVGEDGPTHQPIETLAALRAIPNMRLLRPGDAEESVEAWKIAMNHKIGPTALVLTRQNIAVYEKDDPDWKESIKMGAYVVKNTETEPDITILATGSEVSLALDALEISKNKNVRVLSVLDRELFLAQDALLQETLIGRPRRLITVEAGSKMGWEGLASSKEDAFHLDSFGESAPGAIVAEHFSFTKEALASCIDRD
jgi:transketolase